MQLRKALPKAGQKNKPSSAFRYQQLYMPLKNKKLPTHILWFRSSAVQKKRTALAGGDGKCQCPAKAKD